MFLVSASDCVFPSSFHAEPMLARGQRVNFLNPSCVHQYGSMNPHKAVRIELLLHRRGALPQHVRA